MAANRTSNSKFEGIVTPATRQIAYNIGVWRFHPGMPWTEMVMSEIHLRKEERILLDDKKI